MRKLLSKRILVTTAVVLAVGGLLLVSAANNDDALLQQIKPYRTWTLVNPTPVVMNPRAAADCAVLSLNPHEMKWASVYVNDKGADAMKLEHPIFPEGSIIVKEKLGAALAKEPELLTVMIKRSKGFNPESRDWEYLVVDGPAEKILDGGRLSRCNECHEKYVYTDFVTMRYINPKPEL